MSAGGLPVRGRDPPIRKTTCSPARLYDIIFINFIVYVIITHDHVNTFAMILIFYFFLLGFAIRFVEGAAPEKKKNYSNCAFF